jgi:hypothetical protein
MLLQLTRHLIFLIPVIISTFNTLLASNFDQNTVTFITSPASLDDASTPLYPISPTDAQRSKSILLANRLPLTNCDYDEAQASLDGLSILRVPNSKYWALKSNLDGYENDYSGLYVSLLENGTKVLGRQKSVFTTYNQYEITDAIFEALAARLARGFFDEPTVPPTLLMISELGEYQLRQYFIDGAIPFTNDPEFEHELYHSLLHCPIHFNRPGLFAIELSLFDDFFAFSNRHSAQHLMIPYDNTSCPNQIMTFFSTNYRSSFYDFEKAQIIPTQKGARFANALDIRVGNLRMRINQMLVAMQSKDIYSRDLCTHLERQASEKVPLHILFCQIYLLRDSRIWDARKIRQLFQLSREGKINSILSFLMTETIHHMPPAIFVQKILDLSNAGIPFETLFTQFYQLQTIFDAFQQLRTKIAEFVHPQDIDDVLAQMSAKPLFDVPFAPLSTILKLEYLSQRYPQILNEVKGPHFALALSLDDQFSPSVFSHPLVRDGDIFGQRFLSVMNAWHNLFLNNYKGRTFDDRDRGFQLLLSNDHLTQRMISSSKFCHTETDEFHQPWEWDNYFMLKILYSLHLINRSFPSSIKP